MKSKDYNVRSQDSDYMDDFWLIELSQFNGNYIKAGVLRRFAG
jgi:hypothetical protein